MIVIQKGGENSQHYLEIIKLEKNLTKDMIVKIIKIKNIIFLGINHSGLRI